jgi:hypothetical protein
MSVVAAGRNLTLAARELRDSLAGANAECQRSHRPETTPGEPGEKRSHPAGRAANAALLGIILGGIDISPGGASGSPGSNFGYG